jgi:predicted lipoprotein with Yx(FWY)xxD motif
MKRILSRQNTYLIGILVPLLLAVTACASTPASTPAPKDSYTIMTMTKIGLGNYLVDAKGMTLYYYANDSTGKSNASDAVIANWPIFYVDDVVAPPQYECI